MNKDDLGICKSNQIKNKHGAETTALKKYDNSTPQKPSHMLSYSPGHAEKMGEKNPIRNLPQIREGCIMLQDGGFF